MTDATGDRGKRVVAGEDLPCAAHVSRAGGADPFGDVAVHGARHVAGRRRVDVLRQRGPPRARPENFGRAGGPDARHDVARVHAVSACSCSWTQR